MNGPRLYHDALGTTFTGLEHELSTPEVPIHQYLGIKYASIPARFRQSTLCTAYPPITDASTHGPICPQLKTPKSVEEEMFGVRKEHQKQILKQNEFECLNLNITCPPASARSKLPVMVWIHGGGDRGSGSSWAYDGGSLVRKSLSVNSPVILVTINFRIGLFGFAASPLLLADNKAAGNEGVGNYGLHDQRLALVWISNNISAWGGDPSNVTLLGSSTGAADILSHLLSSYNQTHPLFHRAILQSALVDPCPPSVSHAGSHLSRLLCSILSGAPCTPERLRAIDADTLVKAGASNGVVRVTDDGVWFRDGWRSWFHYSDLMTPGVHHSSHARRSTSRAASDFDLSQLQPIIIGDSSPSLPHAPSSATSHFPASLSSLWTPPLLTRRLKAVCQSLSKASRLLSAYDLDGIPSSSEEIDENADEWEEVEERVRDLVHDARVAWPTECVATAARNERGGKGVWRYVFDEEGAEDVRCFFDNAPPSSGLDALSESICSASSESSKYTAFSFDEGLGSELEAGGACGSPRQHHIGACDSSSEEEEREDKGEEDEDLFDDGYWGDAYGSDSDSWASPYSLVRDALQSRWLTFAHGQKPWSGECIYVFGPEGETGERSGYIFEGRRRRHVWKDALEPLGMGTVWKVGVELCRGPPSGARF